MKTEYTMAVMYIILFVLAIPAALRGMVSGGDLEALTLMAVAMVGVRQLINEQRGSK